MRPEFLLEPTSAAAAVSPPSQVGDVNAAGFAGGEGAAGASGFARALADATGAAPQETDVPVTADAAPGGTSLPPGMTGLPPEVFPPFTGFDAEGAEGAGLDTDRVDGALVPEMADLALRAATDLGDPTGGQVAQADSAPGIGIEVLRSGHAADFTPPSGAATGTGASAMPLEKMLAAAGSQVAQPPHPQPLSERTAPAGGGSTPEAAAGQLRLDGIPLAVQRREIPQLDVQVQALRQLAAEPAGQSLFSGFNNGSHLADDTGSQSSTSQGGFWNTLQWLAGGERTTAPPLSLTVQAPLQQGGRWGEEVGQHLKWLLSQNLQAAELKLNPPQLGSVEVRISVQQEQVSLHFSTPHALVKETVEDSLPRLRAMLQDSGFQLVDVDVSQQDPSARQDRRPDTPAHTSAWNTPESDAGGLVEEAGVPILQRQGLVDLYA